MNVSKVQVLLSTYNGEKYLKEQLDSLLAQDYPNIDILIRDDGSKDSTKQILTGYENHKNISVIYGSNIGIIASFLELLKISDPEAEFFAFCDQDDVWLKDKISRAVGFLDQYPKENSLLYCSRTTLVDENLNIIGQSEIPKRGPSFKNALVQNIATGCTIVINRMSRELLMKEIPKTVGMHDWWMYLVVSAFGKVIYDTESKILYRQHSSNAIGYKTNTIARWVARIQRFLRSGGLYLVTEQAKEFKRIYDSLLPKDKKVILDRFIDDRKSFVGRLRYSFSSEVYRQSRVDDIILRLLIIINRV